MRTRNPGHTAAEKVGDDVFDLGRVDLHVHIPVVETEGRGRLRALGQILETREAKAPAKHDA